MVCIVAIITIMNFSVCYGASKVKEPGINAKSENIAKYAKENDISKVELKKLVKWYDTSGEAGDYNTIKKIEKAIKGKNAKEVKNYVESTSPSDLSDISATVLTMLKNIAGSSMDADTAYKLEEIKKEANKEEVIDPTINPNAYNPGKAKSSKVNGLVGPIVGAIKNIGIAISVIILMIIGIKYMLGSFEEKATYKQTLLPYLIGAVILFTGSFIPSIIYNTMK